MSTEALLRMPAVAMACRVLICMLVAAAPLLAPVPAAAAEDCIVLLHGLGRGTASMKRLAAAFSEHDYAVANVAYPSRSAPIPELSEQAVGEGIARCPAQATLHFVTHSMGGILVRQYLADASPPRLGRVVMLAPPNQGSELVDALRETPLFGLIAGPAGEQLGTDAGSLPAQLGPADYELGIIAGTRSLNPLFSSWLPEPDDGRVSVASTRLAGMQDFIALPFSHRFITRKREVADQALAFIEHGRFLRATP